MNSNSIGQPQNIVTTMGATGTAPGIISMSGQQQQQQVLGSNVNAVMDIDTSLQSNVMTSQHSSLPILSTSPAPGLGNLQSVVGSGGGIMASTTTTATSHSPLTTALQSNSVNITSSPSTHGTQVKSSSTSSVSTSSHDTQSQILTRPRLQDLVREVDPTEQLDEEVEELLLQLADDFVESTVGAACLLAKHRRATTVEVKDVQLHLERHWNMWLPGFGTDELRPYKRAVVTEAHKQRLALIRKALKKY